MTRKYNPNGPGGYKYVKTFRERKKQKAVEYLGGRCKICGYNKHYKVLEFHHLEPSQKDFSISMGHAWSFERIRKELDKCVCLCPNCHREVHLGLVVVEGFAPPT
jgi:predicted HNH restriction endonuclease